MKITKLPHACLIIEIDGEKLVVDPSEFFAFDADFATPEHVAAVVYTHNHSDHYDPKNLAKLVAKNPEMKIFASADTAKNIAQDLPNLQPTVAQPGENQTVAKFNLDFFGGRHAHIVPGDDKGDNVGVVVNAQLVYPGDSFDYPDAKSLAKNFVLALPTTGPWLKIGDAMTYLRDFAPTPTEVFPTHNGLGDARANTMTNSYLAPICAEKNIQFVDLAIGQNLEI